jgi:exopolyphosphatase/guanosine-5'-triphosphate,3'-diphosphate pyrophosphatase
MQQRIGVIDLGSNTTRLIVMAFEPHHAFKLHDEIKETVRLVEGAANNVLQPAPIDRAVKALQMFANYARATGIPRVIGVATSAMRDATNQPDVLRRIVEHAGLQFRVLSGDEEARYGYLGAANSLRFRDGFMIDIGGGSAQVSQVREREFLQATSMPIGAVRMTERFFQADPPTKAEWQAFKDHLAGLFRPLDWFKLDSDMQLVGMGGTIRNLANIDQHMRGYPLDRLHAYELSREQVELITDELRRRSSKQRLELPGLNDERADVILAGALVLRQLMRAGKASSITISGEGLREGVFYEQFLPNQTPPLIPNLRSFAIENLVRVYGYEPLHVAKVGELVLQMFDQLVALHGYGAWERELLDAAAMVHNVGVRVNYYDHYKHGAYMILNSALPGWSHREIAIIALLVRGHRKGAIELGNLAAILHPDDEQRIMRLASLLRIAEYLERSKGQVVRALRCEGGDPVRIMADTVGDATVEIWDANRHTSLFRKAFGIDVEIK